MYTRDLYMSANTMLRASIPAQDNGQEREKEEGCETEKQYKRFAAAPHLVLKCAQHRSRRRMTNMRAIPDSDQKRRGKRRGKRKGKGRGRRVVGKEGGKICIKV